jgi:glucosamine--fructose-6-phosphate aminotransferase (isomerizing)
MMDILTRLLHRLKSFAKINIECGKTMSDALPGSLIILPYQPNTLGCGICALVAFKPADGGHTFNLDRINEMADHTSAHLLEEKSQADLSLFLGGLDHLNRLFDECQALKTEDLFARLFFSDDLTRRLEQAVDTIGNTIQSQQQSFKKKSANMAPAQVESAAASLERLQDIGWCLDKEILMNIRAIGSLAHHLKSQSRPESLAVFKRINAVLNSLDRLEVRGRDSAGISVIFTFTKDEFERFREAMIKAGLSERLKQRTNHTVLTNNSLTINDTFPEDGSHLVTISFVYKFAAEIGALGDNIAFIRSQIKNDLMLQLMSDYDFKSNSVSAHTRWASVGDITLANCHPVDNTPTDREIGRSGIIHVCLNGDIDNYLELKTEYEAHFDKIHEDINTDTKLIPLQIETYLRQGKSLEEAFRLALNDFQGSHAISMHSDLAPGKLFLAQRGSGQAIFVGIAKDHYIAASELYGVVEETQQFIKLNGEEKGQIVVLDQHSPGGVEGIRSYYYDNSPIQITDDQIQNSQITSRDIDRQDFPHYFLKEISESPASVEKTLENKFRQSEKTHLYSTSLDDRVIPASLLDDLKTGQIRKVFFIGQGTAGIAAQGCADLLNYYLGDQTIDIRAMKSSELSGFCIIEDKNQPDTMANTLVVAISQSGTTTDTNRTVDMVKGCGARTLAIVNRRDSDLTFKTDGVFYTSSGRDIEMSVASTKAFYSQITAGAVLGLHIARIMGKRSADFITEQINEILTLPDKMRAILSMKEAIKDSAMRLAVSKNYWATVGSGANKTSADEIRIKLSELCYKTISSDFIEDKKHIDLSSEPLIIICAAGTRESVLGDIIKDTAIFHAHKATPVVITTQEEDRFDLYAADVFKIPGTLEHFSPILNTLVGHIWGYYAALAINEGSRFLYQGRSEVQELLDEFTAMGHDTYEVLLEKRFRESIAQLYNKFSTKRKQNGFPAAMGLDTAANITLLFKYLSGRLPVSDFEIDFDTKGTPANMLTTFFDTMGQAINAMARPVDAIKHQAKTVTVGTSRIAEKFEGLIFDELAANDIQIAQLTNKNVLVLKNLQEVIAGVNGGFLYRIAGLSLLGEVTRTTRIELIKKSGTLVNEHSRVEEDPKLKGTKNIIVREGNVYIGKGRKDKKNILVIPVISANPATPNIIEYILSLNVSFKTSGQVPLLKKIKALGGKYNRLKDWILESDSISWDDKFLNLIEVETLFGETAEKAVELIIEKIK